MEAGKEQLRAIRDIIVKLDEYDFVKQRNKSVVGLDDDFRKFREQLQRVQSQLVEHLR